MDPKGNGGDLIPPPPSLMHRLLPPRLIVIFHGLDEPQRVVDAAEAPFWVAGSVLAQVAIWAKRIELQITFDDGNASDYEVALPMLADAGLSGTFFVLAGRLDQPGSLRRAQVREMAALGMTIGSHGHDHVRWTSADDPTMRRELHDARAKIEDCLGTAVTELSIPFGAFDARVMRLVAEAGYRHVHTSAKAMASPASWFLPRYTIAQWTDVEHEIPAWTSLPSRLRSGMRNELRARKFGFSTSTAGPGQ